MAKRIRKSEPVPEERPIALGELIHAQVRIAIETAVHEELAVALGAEGATSDSASAAGTATDGRRAP